MNAHIVIYRMPSKSPFDAEAFACDACGQDDAEEQCNRAFPGCDVLWVYEGSDKEAAFAEYWNA